MNAPRGYTLVEVVVAMASASVLMIGLSSVLFVSARALEMDDGATLRQSRAEQAISRMEADLAEATRIESLSDTAVSFYVPDRDNDGVEEQLGFSWSGVAGDPLMHDQNGRSAVLLNDVTSLNLAAFTQSLNAQEVTATPPVPWPVLESTSSVVVDSPASALTLPKPTGVASGELLIAAIAIEKDHGEAAPSGSGWAALDVNQEANKVTLGVWWKIAADTEPDNYTWTWSGNDEAIGVGLRISNQYAGNPITAFVPSSGRTAAPECLAAGVTLDHSMAFRFGGFHEGNIATPGVTGLPGHTDIYMDDASNDVSLGLGYRIIEAAGAAEASSFELTGTEEYRTLTVVIAPESDG